jgi:hypothetical protein
MRLGKSTSRYRSYYAESESGGDNYGDDDIDASLEAHDQAVWEERSSVRAEIEAMVRRYHEADEQPPFKAAEQIVIAILCSSKHSIDMVDVISWCTSTFKFYRTKALQDYAMMLHPDSKRQQVRVPMLKKISKGLDVWEGPITPGRYDESATWWLDQVCSKEVDQDVRITSPANAGRIFL